MNNCKWRFILCLALMLTLFLYSPAMAKTSDPYFFAATNQSVDLSLRSYWNAHGGVALLGMPVSPTIVEDRGGPFLQYFERAELEFDGYDSNGQLIISSLSVGATVLDSRYPNGVITATSQTIPGTGSHTFTETEKLVSGVFRSYWRTHGGLAQFGNPLTYPFYETSQSNGKRYIVQYFERARFEYHPEQSNPRNRVMLGLVGREAYQKYLNPKSASGGEQCSFGVSGWFTGSFRRDPDLSRRLGCATEPDTDYNGEGGYQAFVNAQVLISAPVDSSAYAYVLYPDHTFQRFEYQGPDSAGGDPPLPAPHFYKVATRVGNLGDATGWEVWRIERVQHFERGILFYIQGATPDDVFSISPGDSQTGRWSTEAGVLIPPDGP